MATDETRAELTWREPGWRPDYGDPLFIAEMRRQLAALYGRVPEEEWVFEVDVDGWTG
jgi:hypothetical protein